MEVSLRTTCANGKVWSHKTTLEDIPEGHVTNAGDAGAATNAGDDDIITNAGDAAPASPKRIHPTVRANPLQPKKSTAPKAKKNSKGKEICRICGQSSQTSFWLGYSYRHPKTKRQDCTCWVHHNCIGLYYKSERGLEKVPFYCKKHTYIVIYTSTKV